MTESASTDNVAQPWKSRQPSRRIPEHVWARYRDEIENLYVNAQPPMSLAQLMRHFEHNHGFGASKKQWKDHLSKVAVKRNLDRQSAAIILALLNEADSQSVNRKVYFNRALKTRDDIKSYIRKSSVVMTETELLANVPKDRLQWPASITWHDAAHEDENIMSFESHCSADLTSDFVEELENADSTDHTPAQRLSPPVSEITNQGTASELLPSSLLAENPLSGLAGWTTSYDVDYLHRQASVLERTRSSSTLLSSEPFRWPSGRTTQTPWNWIEDPTHDVMGMLENFGGPGQLRYDQPMSLNMLASVTPVTLTIDGQMPGTSGAHRIEKLVGAMLKDAAGEGVAQQFARACLESCIHLGQGNEDACAKSIGAAALTFQDLVSARTTFQKSLSILNVVSFLLETYGQKEMKIRILEELQRKLQMSESLKSFVIKGSIDFMLKTCDWSCEVAQSVLSTIRELWLASIESAGKGSWLALSAQYNVAWVQLEAGQVDEALSCLNNARAQCETAFGLYALQTISWLATQARAHFKKAEYVTAEALMTEVVMTRAEKAFSKQHPVYWEIHYRIGLFLLQIASHNSQLARTQECWMDGEDMLRSTLVWRAKELGPNNPQTLNAYKWLKHYLELQHKNRDAATLHDWYRARASE